MGAFATAAVLLLAACTSGESQAGKGAGSDASSAVSGGTLLVTAGPGDLLAPLDPRTGYAPFPANVLRCCLVRNLLNYNGRSAADGGSIPRPDLATSFPDVSEDGLTWTFHIRKGIHYAPPMQDTEIVAQDFVRALEREATPITTPDTTYAFYYSVIEGFDDFAAQETDSISGLETPDDHTLVVHLTEPTGDFGERMSLPASGPLPAGAADGHDNYGSFLVATGPYMVEGSEDLDPSLPPAEQKPAIGWAPGHHIYLVRNPSWERADDPLRRAYPDRIEITAPSLPEKTLEPGPATRKLIARMAVTVQSAEADVAVGTWAALGSPDVARYRASGASPERLFEQPAGGIVSLPMRLSMPPFDDVHVRRAVLLASNREKIRSYEEELFGIQTVALQHTIPNTLGRDLLRSYAPYPELTGDLDAAKKEMRLSSYDENGDGVCDASVCKDIPTLTYTPFVKIIRSMNGDLAGIGVHLSPKVHDSDYGVQRASAEAHFGMDVGPVYWIPDYPNPSAVFVPLLSKRGPPEQNLNFSLMGASAKELESYGYDVTDVPTIEDRIRGCMRVLGQAQIECWNELDQYVTEEVVPYIPIATPASYFLRSSRLGGFSVDQLSFQPALDQVWVDGPAPTVSNTSGPEPGVATSLPQPTKRCGVDGAKAETVWFDSADGTAQLEGALVGKGSRGVVLAARLFAHGYLGSLCEAWPYASYLAKRGFKVLAFDYRCFGYSTCPEDARPLDDDVAGAIAELRRRGATSVSVIGAELGANAALIAASEVTPRVSSVVALSSIWPRLFELRPEDHVQDLDAPVLYAGAKDPFDPTFPKIKELYAATGSKDKRLIAEPPEWGIGWELFTAGWGNETWSPLAGEIADFLAEHAKSQ